MSESESESESEREREPQSMALRSFAVFFFLRTASVALSRIRVSLVLLRVAHQVSRAPAVCQRLCAVRRERLKGHPRRVPASRKLTHGKLRAG